MKIIAYLAVSLDGYIADSEGSVDWLNELPNAEQSDYGFNDFMNSVDAILMGANTFRTVQSFGVWPYTKPVYVASNSIKTVPHGFEEKITLTHGNQADILKSMNEAGFDTIYVDGGIVVKNCIDENLLDEIYITHVPVTLGAGITLFPNTGIRNNFEHIMTEVVGQGLVKSHYKMKKHP